MSAGDGEGVRRAALAFAVVTAAIWIPAGFWLVALGIQNDWDVEIVASDTAHMAIFPGGFLLAGGVMALLVAGALRRRRQRWAVVGMFVVAGLGVLASGLMGEWLQPWQWLIVAGWLGFGLATVVARRSRV